METVLMVEVRPYFHHELRELFKAKRSSFNNDLKPHRKKLGKRAGHKWSIAQVEMILQLLGRPYKIITV
jgi:hypothetical protein